MAGRERILAALDGREPDRVPLALAFYHLDGAALAPPGAWRDDLVDIAFVDFPVSDEEEELRRRMAPNEGNTRIGSRSQVARYAAWQYRPETPETGNPLEGATSLADLERLPFPAVGGPRIVDRLAREVDDLHRRGLAAGGNTPHLGGELFEAAWRLRGLESFLVDLVERKEMAHFLLDRLAALARRNVTTLVSAGIDVLALDDDVGMPGTMMISPATWREFFKPRMAGLSRPPARSSPTSASSTTPTATSSRSWTTWWTSGSPPSTRSSPSTWTPSASGGASGRGWPCGARSAARRRSPSTTRRPSAARSGCGWRRSDGRGSSCARPTTWTSRTSRGRTWLRSSRRGRTSGSGRGAGTVACP